jgi:hypothetical protein
MTMRDGQEPCLGAVVLCFLLDPSVGSGIRLSWDSDMNRREFLVTSAATGLGRGIAASSDGSRIDRVALVKRHSPVVAEADIHPPRSFAAMRKKRLYFASLLNQNFCIAFANSVPSKNFRTNSGGETLQRGSRTRISYTLPPMLIPIRRIVMWRITCASISWVVVVFLAPRVKESSTGHCLYDKTRRTVSRIPD